MIAAVPESIELITVGEGEDGGAEAVVEVGSLCLFVCLWYGCVWERYVS